MKIKGMNGEEHNVTSQGQGALNTVLGAVGTYGALNNGALGGLLGGLGGNNCNGNWASTPISRYEASMMQELAKKRWSHRIARKQHLHRSKNRRCVRKTYCED
jgi:hypothetical protein